MSVCACVCVRVCVCMCVCVGAMCVCMCWGHGCVLGGEAPGEGMGVHVHMCGPNHAEVQLYNRQDPPTHAHVACPLHYSAPRSPPTHIPSLRPPPPHMLFLCMCRPPRLPPWPWPAPSRTCTRRASLSSSCWGTRRPWSSSTTCRWQGRVPAWCMNHGRSSRWAAGWCWVIRRGLFTYCMASCHPGPGPYRLPAAALTSCACDL